MADAFVAIFKGFIIGKINSVVNSAIPPIIKSVMNNMVAKTEGLAYLTKELAFDFTFDSEPQISDTTMALYLNASMYNITSGYRIPGTEINDIEILASSPNSV